MLPSSCGSLAGVLCTTVRTQQMFRSCFAAFAVGWAHLTHSIYFAFAACALVREIWARRCGLR